MFLQTVLPPALSLPVLLLAALGVLHPFPAVCHSWLTSPSSYVRRSFRARTCPSPSHTVSQHNHTHPFSLPSPRCPLVCPRFSGASASSWTLSARTGAVTPDAPAATWARGQRVSVTWTRNNHHGGFVRLSLVPLAVLHSPSAHARLALLHACWETGEHECASAEDCGTDKAGEAYSATLQVPTVFPDGTYALAYVWYGGLEYKRTRGKFPDYHSCSFVRVAGGAKLGGRFAAPFEAGDDRRSVNDRCPTSARRIGKCIDYGCPNQTAFFALPSPFAGGAAPAPVTAADVRRIARGALPSPRPSPTRQKLCRSTPSPGAKPNAPGPGSGSVGSSRDGDDVARETGVCKGRVCCLRSCGRCGGKRCARRPGGGHACCIGRVKRSKRMCARKGPPCVLGKKKV